VAFSSSGKPVISRSIENLASITPGGDVQLAVDLPQVKVHGVT
jgi:hypothetical protein